MASCSIFLIDSNNHIFMSITLLLHIHVFKTGNRILAVEVPKTQLYPLKLKGISICFLMLKAALCGNYVNFGVFRLYGDEALDNVRQIFSHY